MQMVPMAQLPVGKKVSIAGQSGKLWRWKRSHHQWLLQFKWKWQKPWKLSEMIRHSDKTMTRTRPRPQLLPHRPQRVMWKRLFFSFFSSSPHGLTRFTQLTTSTRVTMQLKAPGDLLRASILLSHGIEKKKVYVHRVTVFGCKFLVPI